MGDTCYMTLTCRPEHSEVFTGLGFDVEQTNPDGSLLLRDEQANYAHDSVLRELAAKGITFIAEHASGDEYGDGCYVSDGHRLVHVDCLRGGGLPVVEVGADGLPDADQMKLVEKYREVLAAAKVAITAGIPPGRRWSSADEILKTMDPALFRGQRRLLERLIADGRQNLAGPTNPADLDLLDGLGSMLDDIADYAHDVLGMDCLLEEAEPTDEGE